MLATISIEQIDQQLNELEELARSGMPAARFFSQLSERLRLVLGAQGCLIFLPASAGAMLPLAQAGNVTPETMADFTRLRQAQPIRVLKGATPHQAWLAIALRQTNYEKGGLLVTFAERPTEEATDTIIEIMSAFGEVAAAKQLGDMERFFDERWQALQSACVHIAQCKQPHDAAVSLVNHLVTVLGAARVTLAASNWLSSTEIMAISGVPSVDSRTSVAQALRKTADEVWRTGQPVIRQRKSEHSHTNETSVQVHASEDEPAEDGLFSNLVSLPLSVQRDGSPIGRHLLTIEWQNHTSMLSALPLVSLVLPILGGAWMQHARWLRVPSLLRSLLSWDWRFGKHAGQLLKWTIVLAGLFLAYRVLTSQYSLNIEAPATLEPTLKRAIFASADGFVEEVLVEDGQQITAGHVVARLRSPSMELQMEELRGQQRTLAERRSGLRVATGQIDPSSRDALITQSRLSAEIAQLNTQEANLEQQLKLLGEERAKLELVSPITGTIIARDIKQQLVGRPVRRGDALMNVADLAGPWHLRIEVPDRDSGYVQDSLQPTSSHEVEASPAQQANIEFVLDALPEEHFHGHVNWVSSVVQNRHGEGCYLEIHAQVDRQVVDQSQMGAGARVWFRCGEQPLWFVWCRPLVEAAQRKLWFWSEQANEVPVRK